MNVLDGFRPLADWFRDHEAIAWGIGLGSAVAFVATLAAIPWIVGRIPADYFVRERRLLDPGSERRGAWAWRIPLRILRNLLGWVLIVAGVAMLVLPGQGLMTMLLGMLLIDFPGKRALERWLIGRPRIQRGLQWMRERAKAEPLELPEE